MIANRTVGTLMLMTIFFFYLVPGLPLEEQTHDGFRKTEDDYGWGFTPQEPRPMEADVYASWGVTPQEEPTTPIADVYASWGVTPQEDLKPTEAVVSTTNGKGIVCFSLFYFLFL